MTEKRASKKGPSQQTPATAERMPMAAERQPATVYPRLVLKDRPLDSAENIFLTSAHYLDVVMADLYKKTHDVHGQPIKVTADNVVAVSDTIRPFTSTLYFLHNGMSAITSLLVTGQRDKVISSAKEAEGLFEEVASKKPEIQNFIATYSFDGEEVVSAHSFLKTYLKHIFDGVKAHMSYVASPAGEVDSDLFGGDMKGNVSQFLAIINHDWGNAVTKVSPRMELVDRVLLKPNREKKDLEVAAYRMDISAIGAAEKTRQRLQLMLHEGFVPEKIPLKNLLANTVAQVQSYIGEQVTFEASKPVPEGASVHTSPVLLHALIENAVQNAQRAVQSQILAQDDKGISVQEAAEEAARKLKMHCSVAIDQTKGKVRLFFTDNGRGILDGRRVLRFSQGKHGYGREGVPSTGIAMHTYANDMRLFDGFTYLIQQSNPQGKSDISGATLVITLPMHIDTHA